ncbi:MAG: MoxR family ATPase [Bacteroidetes bacterium]|nr:MoxR family ATPase [Bacteroidota bacterium]MBU1718315.1 MoxR family ATPase [Bacteroidota bacterium]
MEYSNDVEAVEALRKKYEMLRKEVAKIIVGQDEIVRQIVTAIFSNGHCLLIGVPGLAKTLMINTIGEALGMTFSRIQFTPDLMPSDIVGTEILDESRKFRFIPGPIFANIILADEINRTPPKTQSAMLEAMQERAVTTSGKTFKLDEPFFVLATQNPIEQEGTYPLPEAQLDRFMFNIWLDYPTFEEEKTIVRNTTTDHAVKVENILDAEEVLFFQKLVRKVPVPDNVLDFAVRLATKTRPKTDAAHHFANEYLAWGAGPRASQFLIIGAKCHAALHGKYSPDIEDIKSIALPVLRHRFVRNYKAEAENISPEDIVQELLRS